MIVECDFSELYLVVATETKHSQPTVSKTNFKDVFQKAQLNCRLQKLGLVQKIPQIQ